MKILVEIVTQENGEEILYSTKMLHTSQPEKTRFFITDELPFDNAPSPYHVGEYIWNQQEQKLEEHYKEVFTQERLEQLNKKVEELLKADQELGTQITDIDLGLIEHKVVDHEL